MRKSGFSLFVLVFLLVFSFGFLAHAESDEVQEWIDALKDEDPRIRETAAEILGKLKDLRAIGPLILASVDGDSKVREAASKALQAFPGWEKSDEAKSVVPKLIEALKDGDLGVRGAAAEILGRLKDPRAIGPLILARIDEVPEVRKAASEALKAFPEWEKSDEAKNSVPQFIEALKDEDSEIREAAAEALGKIKDREAVESLIAMLQDVNKDSEIRTSAARALGKIKDPKAVKPLIAILRDESEDFLVRKSAILALGEIQDPRAVEPLIAALGEKDSRIGDYVFFALLNFIQSSRAVESFTEALKSEDPSVRAFAAFILGMLKDPRAVESLVAMLKDKNENSEVRKFAVLALIQDPRGGGITRCGFAG